MPPEDSISAQPWIEVAERVARLVNPFLPPGKTRVDYWQPYQDGTTFATMVCFDFAGPNTQSVEYIAYSVTGRAQAALHLVSAMTSDSGEYLTTQQLADLLGVPPRHVRDLTRRKRLPVATRGNANKPTTYLADTVWPLIREYHERKTAAPAGAAEPVAAEVSQ